MQPGIELPVPGRIARVRQRMYLVEETVPPPQVGESPLVRLSCLDDDAQGQPLEVLWDRELDAELVNEENWKSLAAKGFDEPRQFASYLHVLRWNCLTATDPKLFQSPFRAGIRLDAYQLEPLRKALLLPRVNLFIADDVGLGKTIEAGLIAAELLIRKKVREIVVSCPPSMLYQWQVELEQRFGMTFVILDKEYVGTVRRERGWGVNPWTTHSRFLVSQRLLIDEEYTAPLRDWLGDFKPGSLLILDEAHHAAPASGQRYAVDSQLTKAVRELARRFEHRLFLSATPHNGHSNSFSSLLEILDPQRFCQGVPVVQKQLDEVMVRRLKNDLRETVGGFPERKVVPVVLEGLPDGAPELRLAAMLDEYRSLRESRLAGESVRKRALSGLLLINLQQRLFSSIEAFARTLRVHRKTVERQAAEAVVPQNHPRQGMLDLLAAPAGSDDERTENTELLEAEEEAQVELATSATSTSAHEATQREHALLQQMDDIAQETRHEPDARVVKLIDWIRKNQCPQGRWNNLRVILFTEYDDTQRYLRQQLEEALADTVGRIRVFHGPTSKAERREIQEAFNGDPAKHPVRILIATDAAREGLNLQAQCWNLFHVDLPWNPSRLEQRNGRIDRKLQPNAEVFCQYFMYKQRPEDRILQALVRKTETIKRELGSLSQVIDQRLTKLLERGLSRDRVDALVGEITDAELDPEFLAATQAELEQTRLERQKLEENLETLRNRLDSSKQALGLDQAQFRAALNCSLELIGGTPLHQVSAENGGMFTFPELDRRDGADSSWGDTLDSLRVPRQRDQTSWEWRKNAPLRPVIFEDEGVVDGQAVHLHLAHRVVQRLLGRFMAQGFVHHDLSRACLAQTTDAIPRVILLGRLCLYGNGAARLHEELVMVTARFQKPEIRKGPLTPYAREAETKTLQLLEESLLRPRSALTDAVRQQLLDAAPQDIRDLRPHLDQRARDFAADARAKLQQRAETEARAMSEILKSQQKHIRQTLEKVEQGRTDQLRFSFPDEADERRQVEDNKRWWAKRLIDLNQELTTEPERIKKVYEVQAERIEPVGLIYLWPVSG